MASGIDEVTSGYVFNALLLFVLYKLEFYILRFHIQFYLKKKKFVAKKFGQPLPWMIVVCPCWEGIAANTVTRQ